MDSLGGQLSFGISVTTALVTFYFWIVKARREQPRLKIYAADQAAGHAHSSCGSRRDRVLREPSTVRFSPRLAMRA